MRSLIMILILMATLHAQIPYGVSGDQSAASVIKMLETRGYSSKFVDGRSTMVANESGDAVIVTSGVDGLIYGMSIMYNAGGDPIGSFYDANGDMSEIAGSDMSVEDRGCGAFEDQPDVMQISALYNGYCNIASYGGGGNITYGVKLTSDGEIAMITVMFIFIANEIKKPKFER